MDTQNTPIHIRLWNRDFWLLAIANLLLTMAVYMQILHYPIMMNEAHTSQHYIAIALGTQGLGLFVLGAFCSFLVQKYRRNHVCEMSLIVVAACVFIPMLLNVEQHYFPWVAIGIRFLTGAFFGLAQMILLSTLIVDCTESFQRTEANYAAAWFGRFAVSLGPLLVCILIPTLGFETSICVSTGLTVMAAVLIGLVRFPFRAPEDHVPHASLDRFFMPEGWLLFINLFMVTLSIGIVLSTAHHAVFFSMLMIGFLLALLAGKFVFVNAELKSEAVAGLLVIGVAVIIMLTREGTSVSYIAPVLIGLGAGLIGSRFQLFYIKLSRHCQRGTSQSSFFLAWESGISIGLGLGYFFSNKTHVLETALILVSLALILYVIFTHSWYLKNKNR